MYICFGVKLRSWNLGVGAFFLHLSPLQALHCILFPEGIIIADNNNNRSNSIFRMRFHCILITATRTKYTISSLYVILYHMLLLCIAALGCVDILWKTIVSRIKGHEACMKRLVCEYYVHAAAKFIINK